MSKEIETCLDSASCKPWRDSLNLPDDLTEANQDTIFGHAAILKKLHCDSVCANRNPCSEHGVCVDIKGTAYCACEDGYMGATCDIGK